MQTVHKISYEYCLKWRK